MLYVVRHGKTDWNKDEITMGKMNTPVLCEEGIEEAKKLKEYFADIDIDLIICSPLTRAVETANIINEDMKKRAIIDNRIVERGLGFFECHKYPSPEVNARIWDLNINSDESYIEPMQEFKDRIFDFMDNIVEECKEKNVLLVTHGGVTALINCYFTNKLDDEPIQCKFLKNGEVATYDMKKTKKLVYNPKNML